ncbi:MAG: hypothetical protein WCL30_06195, partial [Pseudomonadota bacterium]
MASIINVDISEARLKFAQDKLVNRTLELALDGLYANSRSALCDVDTDIKIKAEEQDAQGQTVKKYTVVKLLNEQSEPCKNAEELLQAIIKMFPDSNPNYEFDRIGAYNYIASQNRYDLSIKSAGHKSLSSIEEKIGRGRNVFDIGDMARLTMISQHPNILNAFAYKAFGSDSLEEQNCENWEVNKTGVLKRVTKFNIDAIGSEVQFVPREQSQVMRISHKMYGAVRYFDVYERLKMGTEKEEDSNPQDIDKAKAELIEKYNEMAKLINILISDQTLPAKYHQDVNKILASKDMDSFTYDSQGEEGGEDITLSKSHNDPQYTP